MGETRDTGLSLAIEAAGGVGALARGLGIAQPSVSGWSRIPAERVLAVENLTGVPRSALRPDLYADGHAAVVDELDTARAQIYLLLATLLRQPPTARLLARIADIRGDATPIGVATVALAQAARATGEADAGGEFFNLFIGVGRGELVPYASYYLTGFLHERPLQRVREDYVRLGVERPAGIAEPEDGMASLLEAMAGLIRGEFGSVASDQADFFKRHLAPWAGRFFADLTLAHNAQFYRHVGALGATWIDIETQAFELPE